MDRFFFTAGAVAAFIGVAFGAFGAHSLKDRLAPDMSTAPTYDALYTAYTALHPAIAPIVRRLHAVTVGRPATDAPDSAPAALTSGGNNLPAGRSQVPTITRHVTEDRRNPVPKGVDR